VQGLADQRGPVGLQALVLAGRAVRAFDMKELVLFAVQEHDRQGEVAPQVGVVHVGVEAVFVDEPLGLHALGRVGEQPHVGVAEQQR